MDSDGCFSLGLSLFTLASLACGLARTRNLLVAARAVQGLGGAVVTASTLALIMGLFTGTAERARAMGIYGFVCAAGGSIGVLLGGLLTTAFNWHWIFLVNLPLGIGVYRFCLRLLPHAPGQATTMHLDVAGALSVTAALMLAVYAVVNGNQAGWTPTSTLSLFIAAATLFVLFLVIETRVRAPLMPLRLFRLRSVAVANAAGVLWAAAMFAWFSISALYMQRVLGYSALQIGLAFLPANLIMAAFSLGVSAKLVMRFGIRPPFAIGLLLAGVGLALFARASLDASYVAGLLPGMLILGLGAGMALNPVSLAAMSDVKPSEAGLASGIVNTSFMMGGALGLAVLASLSAARSSHHLAAAAELPSALADGYQLAFGVGAVFAIVAALLGATLLRPTAQRCAPEGVSGARLSTRAEGS